MTGITKEEVLASNLEEEASVLEIHNELVRRIGDENPAELRIWLKAQLAHAAQQGHVGFYLDEFGARDVRDIETEEAMALLESAQTWSTQSDTMLHCYSLEEQGLDE